MKQKNNSYISIHTNKNEKHSAENIYKFLSVMLNFMVA